MPHTESMTSRTRRQRGHAIWVRTPTDRASLLSNGSAAILSLARVAPNTPTWLRAPSSSPVKLCAGLA